MSAGSRLASASARAPPRPPGRGACRAGSCGGLADAEHADAHGSPPSAVRPGGRGSNGSTSTGRSPRRRSGPPPRPRAGRRRPRRPARSPPRAVAERQQVVAGRGRRTQRQGEPDRGRSQVADLADEARALQLLGAHPARPSPRRVWWRLAGADRRVGRGGPLGGGLARQRLGRRRRVGVEEHLEAVARLGLRAQAPHVVDLAPGAPRAQAGEAPEAPTRKAAAAGRERVGDALIVADQVVQTHQRRRPAGGGQRGPGPGRRAASRGGRPHRAARPRPGRGPGRGGRQLAQAEGQGLADGDQRAEASAPSSAPTAAS